MPPLDLNLMWQGGPIFLCDKAATFDPPTHLFAAPVNSFVILSRRAGQCRGQRQCGWIHNEASPLRAVHQRNFGCDQGKHSQGHKELAMHLMLNAEWG